MLYVSKQVKRITSHTEDRGAFRGVARPYPEVGGHNGRLGNKRLPRRTEARRSVTPAQ